MNNRVLINRVQAGAFSYIWGLEEAITFLNDPSRALRSMPSLRAQISSDPENIIMQWAHGGKNPYVELTIETRDGKRYLVSNAWVNHFDILERTIEIQFHKIRDL